MRLDAPTRQLQTASNTDEAMTVAVAHSLPLMASAGTDERVQVWNLDTGTCVMSGVGHSGTILALAFSPDDRQLVSTGEDGNILVWNVY